MYQRDSRHAIFEIRNSQILQNGINRIRGRLTRGQIINLLDTANWNPHCLLPGVPASGTLSPLRRSRHQAGSDGVLVHELQLFFQRLPLVNLKRVVLGLPGASPLTMGFVVLSSPPLLSLLPSHCSFPARRPDTVGRVSRPVRPIRTG